MKQPAYVYVEPVVKEQQINTMCQVAAIIAVASANRYKK